MTVFISGGAKCGKSSFAQDLAVALAGNGKRYYVATMIPTGEEDFNRIRRHFSDRDGMGFETVECFKDIMDVANPHGTFLVDSVTSLVQNSLLPVDKNYEMDLNGANRCEDALIRFAQTVRHTSQRRKRLTDEAAGPGSLLGDQRRYCSRLPRWCHCSNHGTSVPGGEQDPL